MQHGFNYVLMRIDAVARVALIAFMAIMILVVSSQVFMRYILNDSIDWADEVSRMAFVWAIFIAIPLGLREGIHVGIDMLVEKFPKQVSIVLGRLMYTLALILMCVVVYETIEVARVTWSERLGAINVSSGYFFVAVIIGSAHTALHLLYLILFPNYKGEEA